MPLLSTTRQTSAIASVSPTGHVLLPIRLRIPLGFFKETASRSGSQKSPTSQKDCPLRPVNTNDKTHYHAKMSLKFADSAALKLVNPEGKTHDHAKISHINISFVEKSFAETGEAGGQNA